MKYFNTMSHNKALEGLCMKSVSLCQCVRLFAGVEQSNILRKMKRTMLNEEPQGPL